MSKESWQGPFHSGNPYRRNEKEIMKKMGEIHELMIEQGFTHPSQVNNLEKAVHIIQEIVMHRICQRDYPVQFPTYSNNEGGWHDVKRI